MSTIQYRLSASELEQAYEALERSSARNLNMLAKQLFLEHLGEREGQAAQLTDMQAQLNSIRLAMEEAKQAQDAFDPDLFMTILCSIFLLTYRAVPVTAQNELNNAVDADAIINYVKEGSSNGSR